MFLTLLRLRRLEVEASKAQASTSQSAKPCSGTGARSQTSRKPKALILGVSKQPTTCQESTRAKTTKLQSVPYLPTLVLFSAAAAKSWQIRNQLPPPHPRPEQEKRYLACRVMQPMSETP